VGRGARSNQRREGRVIGLTRLVEVAATSSPNPVSRGDHRRSGVDKTHRRREMTTLCVLIQRKALGRRKGEGVGVWGRLLVANRREGGGAWCGVRHAAEETRRGGGSDSWERCATGGAGDRSGSVKRQGEVERGVRVHEAGKFGHR
jgi:hypothetical protein